MKSAFKKAIAKHAKMQTQTCAKDALGRRHVLGQRGGKEGSYFVRFLRTGSRSESRTQFKHLARRRTFCEGRRTSYDSLPKGDRRVHAELCRLSSTPRRPSAKGGGFKRSAHSAGPFLGSAAYPKSKQTNPTQIERTNQPTHPPHQPSNPNNQPTLFWRLMVPFWDHFRI